MKAIIHRGQDYALVEGNGIEIDVRYKDGGIVFGHDLIEDKSLPEGDWNKGIIAVNIKQDGLIDELKVMFDDDTKDFFFFDMSVPELVKYIKEGMPVAFRISEFETITVFNVHYENFWKEHNRNNYKLRFWLDCFNGRTDKQLEQLNKLLNLYPESEIFFVSPELHNKDLNLDSPEFLELIKALKKFDDRVIVCTDFINYFLGDK